MTRASDMHPWVGGSAQTDQERVVARLLQDTLLAEGDCAPKPWKRVEIEEAIAERLDVEDGLIWTRRTTASRWFVGATVALAAALLVVAGVSTFDRASLQSQSRSQLVHGSLRIVGDEGIALSDDAVVPQGQRVRAGATPARLQLVGGVTVTVAPGSVLTLDSDSLLTIQRGMVAFDVEPRKAGQAFVVSAGHTQVEVVGTRFSVTRRASRVTARVTEGRVRVSYKQLVTMLDPGESWDSPDADPAPVPPPASQSEPATQDAIVRSPAPPAQEPLPAQTTSDLQLALQQISAGQLDDAAVTYSELGQGEGRGAELSLYLLARLQHKQMGNPQQALMTLANLQNRFDDGHLAEERLLTLLEVMVSLGRCGEAKLMLAELPENLHAAIAQRCP